MKKLVNFHSLWTAVLFVALSGPFSSSTAATACYKNLYKGPSTRPFSNDGLNFLLRALLNHSQQTFRPSQDLRHFASNSPWRDFGFLTLDTNLTDWNADLTTVLGFYARYVRSETRQFVRQLLRQQGIAEDLVQALSLTSNHATTPSISINFPVEVNINESRYQAQSPQSSQLLFEVDALYLDFLSTFFFDSIESSRPQSEVELPNSHLIMSSHKPLKRLVGVQLMSIIEELGNYKKELLVRLSKPEPGSRVIAIYHLITYLQVPEIIYIQRLETLPPTPAGCYWEGQGYNLQRSAYQFSLREKGHSKTPN